jgi:hypothetical protein
MEVLEGTNASVTVALRQTAPLYALNRRETPRDLIAGHAGAANKARNFKPVYPLGASLPPPAKLTLQELTSVEHVYGSRRYRPY